MTSIDTFQENIYKKQRSMCKKMMNIANNQGNENQTTMEYGCYQKDKT